MSNAVERKPFERQVISDDQAFDLRRQLFTQRLTQLEAEHVQAAFAVEQIEQQIAEARVQLEALTQSPPSVT